MCLCITRDVNIVYLYLPPSDHFTHLMTSKTSKILMKTLKIITPHE